MADELKVAAMLSCTLSSGAQQKKRYHATLDVTGDCMTYGVQEIGTSEEEVTQGADLGTPGYVIAKNLDDTNYVEIGSTTGVYDIKLKAGEIALWRHNSATIYAIANTAACDLEHIIIED
ncbi:hypothetical protein ACFLXA_02875 [Chloroflexota bacterium]